MTAKSRATLKAQFATGDVPAGSDYADLIDSCLNLVDTTAQTAAAQITGTTGAFATAVAIGTAAAAGSGLTVVATSETAALKFETPTTAIASGGAGGAVPTSAAGYLIVNVNGTQRRIPYFNVK